jgi:hypothetical protein
LALTTANSFFRALPSNEQQTLVLLLLLACFEVSAFQQFLHGANMPQNKPFLITSLAGCADYVSPVPIFCV